MKTTNLIVILFFLLPALCGCKSGNNKSQSNEVLLGSDTDKHGCIHSAGYYWSNLLQECIRPFETGIRMVPLDTAATDAAYLICSQDSLKLELFLPELDTTALILERQILSDGQYIWAKTGKNKPTAQIMTGLWQISVQEMLIYRQEAPEEAVSAMFYATNDQGQHIHISVLFNNKSESAIMTMDGKDYLLQQYVTASGYGYKNKELNLRGKGEEATLTLANGKTLKLQSH